MQNFAAGSRKKLFNLILLILLLVSLTVVVVRTRARPYWQQKVDEWVVESTDAGV